MGGPGAIGGWLGAAHGHDSHPGSASSQVWAASSCVPCSPSDPLSVCSAAHPPPSSSPRHHQPGAVSEAGRQAAEGRALPTSTNVSRVIFMKNAPEEGGSNPLLALRLCSPAGDRLVYRVGSTRDLSRGDAT